MGWRKTVSSILSACIINSSLSFVSTVLLTAYTTAPRARDRPEKALGIEIYNALDYIRMRNHWNGCGLILHELCHLIHQQVLGLDCTRVKNMHARAVQSGKYSCVLRRDWAGKLDGEDTDLAYCTVDYKEFFAEMSVTYWANGYRELDEASSDKMEACTPPITEPSVLARFGRHHEIGDAVGDTYLKSDVLIWVAAIASNFLPRKTQLPHCNKFYPFTKGQMRHHDSALSTEMESIWNEIAMWEDTKDDSACCSGCWKHAWTSENAKRCQFAVVEEDSAKVIMPIDISDTVDL
jgi:hypothetical protein